MSIFTKFPENGVHPSSTLQELLDCVKTRLAPVNTGRSKDTWPNSLAVQNSLVRCWRLVREARPWGKEKICGEKGNEPVQKSGVILVPSWDFSLWSNWEEIEKEIDFSLYSSKLLDALSTYHLKSAPFWPKVHASRSLGTSPLAGAFPVRLVTCRELRLVIYSFGKRL